LLTAIPLFWLSSRLGRYFAGVGVGGLSKSFAQILLVMTIVVVLESVSWPLIVLVIVTVTPQVFN
jgi:hypothetical protein